MLIFIITRQHFQSLIISHAYYKLPIMAHYYFSAINLYMRIHFSTHLVRLNAHYYSSLPLMLSMLLFESNHQHYPCHKNYPPIITFHSTLITNFAANSINLISTPTWLKIKRHYPSKLSSQARIHINTIITHQYFVVTHHQSGVLKIPIIVHYHSSGMI